MAIIPHDKIEEVRQAVSIVHYISQFVNLRKEGRNMKGLCPFHQEKTPSFVVSPEKQFYHCFGCGRGGNLFSFIMEYEKLQFPEAVKRAADFAGIVLPRPQPPNPEKENRIQGLYRINEAACTFFESNLRKETHKEQKAYFEKRKISEKNIKRFRLGYAPDSYDELIAFLKKKEISLTDAAQLGLIQEREQGGYFVKFRHRMIFPFFNISGQIIGFGGRKLKEEQQPKYLNSPESDIYHKGSTLYGLHQALQKIRDAGNLILVEGYFDLLRLVENDIGNVVASSGTALTEHQAKLIRRYTKEVYICYDGDTAGQKAAIRNARILENQDINTFIVTLPQGEDPDTFVLQNGADAFRAQLKQRVLPVVFQLDQFFSQNPDPSLEEKDAFIHEALNGLAGFNSAIKAGLYIHHLSDKLRVSESMLVSELNRLRRKERRYKKLRREAPEALPQKAEAEPETQKQPAVRKGAYRAEEGLLEALLHADQDVINYIRSHISYDLFDNPVHAALYNIIIDEFEETGAIDLNTLFDNTQEPQQNETGALLAKLMVSSNNLSLKFAKDCIYHVKKWRFEKEANEISRHIRAESESPEAMMHYMTELSRIKKEIAGLERERIK